MVFVNVQHSQLIRIIFGNGVHCIKSKVVRIFMLKAYGLQTAVFILCCLYEFFCQQAYALTGSRDRFT